MNLRMRRDEVLNVLQNSRDELRQFKVKSLALFGSIARGESSSTSDIDLLVEFEGPATYDQYIALKHFLEDILGSKVDLVMNKVLKPRMRSVVEREAIRVA
jgi:predicted nucleotidyltransferase